MRAYTSGTRRRAAKVRRLMLFAIFAAAIGMAVAFRLATYTPPEEAPAPVTPSEAREARRAVESMEEQLADISRAARSGERLPFRVSIGEKEVTDFLSTDQHASRSMKAKGIDKPKVQFVSDSIVTSCYVTTHGRRVHVTVNGRLTKTPDGRMRFQSDRVLLGRLPAPGSVKSRVDRAINDYMMFGTAVLPAGVTEVTSEDGTLTIAGTSEPTLR